MVSGAGTSTRAEWLAGSYSADPHVGNVRTLLSWVLARRRLRFSAPNMARIGRRHPLGPNVGTILRRAVQWGGVLSPHDDRKRGAQSADRRRQFRGLVRVQLSGPRNEHGHHRDADCAA